MHMRMNRRILFGLAFFLPYASALAQQAQSSSPPNRETIAVVLQELDAAWNAREPARFSAVFSEDGSFGFPADGITLHGRGEISGYYVKVFAKMPPDLRHLSTISHFEIMNLDQVAVDFEVDILGTDSKPGNTEKLLRHHHGIGLGVRTDSGWRVRLARVYQAAK
jgi:uncharacterized protein (TIGR02246 family)